MSDIKTILLESKDYTDLIHKLLENYDTSTVFLWHKRGVLLELYEQKKFAQNISKDEFHEILGLEPDVDIHEAVAPSTVVNKVFAALDPLQAMQAITARRNIVNASKASDKAKSFWNEVLELAKKKYAREKKKK